MFTLPNYESTWAMTRVLKLRIYMEADSFWSKHH